MNLLEIRNLRTHLDTARGLARAVDGVDLTIGEGESVGVVGESGSGKSLLALSILGLIPDGSRGILPGSSIRFRGEEMVGAQERQLRRLRGREIAMVFQEPMNSLNPVFTLGTQIVEALTLHRGLPGSAGREEAVRLLEEVGIPDARARLKSYPHQLSGGMRQRAMIAMALAGTPALLLADEPTTALDVTTQAQILALLEALVQERGTAILLISHDLRVVARVCRRVYVLYAGRIVEQGPSEQVLRNPRHPYTRGLLGSRLSLKDRRARLRPIPGEIPKATGWPEGCRFRTRCPDVGPRCEEEPPLFSLAPEGSGPRGGGRFPGDRGARCWFATPGGGAD